MYIVRWKQIKFNLIGYQIQTTTLLNQTASSKIRQTNKQTDLELEKVTLIEVIIYTGLRPISMVIVCHMNLTQQLTA